MIRQRFSLLFLLSLLLAFQPAMAQQTVTWTGASDGFDFTNTGNWDVVPTNSDTTFGIVNTTQLVDDFVISNGGFVEFNGTGALSGPSPWSLSLAGSSSFRLTDNGGTFYGINGGTVTIDQGSSVAAQFITGGVEASIGSGGVFFLNGTGNPINNATINFTGDLTGTVVSLETIGDFTNEHVSKLYVNGSPGSLVLGNISLTTDSSTDYTGDGIPDTVTIAQGISGPTNLFGDLNGDGLINATDWQTFRSNLFGVAGTPVDPASPTVAELQAAYSMGDLDSDFRVTLADFALFDTAYEAANGANSFSAVVPEPSSWPMVSLLSIMALLVFRKSRRALPILGVLLLAGVHLSDARADITYTGQGADPNDIYDEANYDLTQSPLYDPANPTADIITETTQATLSNGTDIPLYDNITFADPAGGQLVLNSLVTLNFGALGIGAGYTTTFDNVAFTTESNGGLSGLNTVASGGSGSGNPCLARARIDVTNGSALDIQFITGALMHVDSTSSVRFRGGGNPINDSVANGRVGLVLEQNASVSFPSANNFSAAGGAGEAPLIWAANASGELVTYASDSSILSLNADGTTGTAVFENTLGARCPLGLVVNEGTGEVSIENPNTSAAFSYDIDSYGVYSTSASLDPASWNSLQDQNLPGFPAGNGTGNGWEEGGQSSAEGLGEAYLLGSSVVSAGATISLGNIYDTAVGGGDVQFTYRDADSGDLVGGLVTYLSPPTGLVCDADGDGDCQLDDIDVMYDQAGTNGSFDLDGNGTVNADDIGLWLAAASSSDNGTNAMGRTIEVGDVNLDYSVQSIDLGILLNNFGVTAASAGAGPGWGGGDLTMDGMVGSLDLGQLLNKFGFQGAAASTAAVPEPNSPGVLLLAMGVAALTLRKRTRR